MTMTTTLTTTKPKLSQQQFFAVIQQMPLGPQRDEAILLAHKKYGGAIAAQNAATGKTIPKKKFKEYRYQPFEYIRTFLKWTAWAGIDADHPGQKEILEACARVMEQQYLKDEFEKGRELTEEELKVWKPGQKIKNWIRVESGNGIGKTKSASGILNWFLDCFKDSTIFTFAPGGKQAQYALWSEIGADREGKGLPGRILETEIKVKKKNFAAHRTVSDGHGKGEERIKGKHAANQLFLLDEADGIPNYVYDAVTSMTSGGHSLVVMFANPKSRASMFYRVKVRSYVQTFRVSTLFHPNVVTGCGDVPGAVKRDFVETKIENDCEILHVHDDSNCKCRVNRCRCYKPVNGVECEGTHKEVKVEDHFDFELPYPVKIGELTCAPGSFFRPNDRFMTDILGITPPNSADNTLIPVGRYEAACIRKPAGGDVTRARVGIDAARFGKDSGTIYIRWQDLIWKTAELFKQESSAYFNIIKPELLKLKEKGVTSVHVRIDAAYGSALIEKLQADNDLIQAFKDYQIYEVHFNGTPYSKDYFNIVTEMYAEAAESLKTLCIGTPSEKLEMDLCDREYKYRNKSGTEVKILEEKKEFKKRKKHSPDDGDGFVLAVAPDFCFNKLNISVISSNSAENARVVKSSPMDTMLKQLFKK